MFFFFFFFLCYKYTHSFYFRQLSYLFLAEDNAEEMQCFLAPWLRSAEIIYDIFLPYGIIICHCNASTASYLARRGKTAGSRLVSLSWTCSLPLPDPQQGRALWKHCCAGWDPALLLEAPRSDGCRGIADESRCLRARWLELREVTPTRCHLNSMKSFFPAFFISASGSLSDFFWDIFSKRHFSDSSGVFI